MGREACVTCICGLGPYLGLHGLRRRPHITPIGYIPPPKVSRCLQKICNLPFINAGHQNRRSSIPCLLVEGRLVEGLVAERLEKAEDRAVFPMLEAPGRSWSHFPALLVRVAPSRRSRRR